MSKQNNVKKATFFLMIVYFLSRILGFIREMIIAKVFGRNAVTDAFFAAFTIPDVMYDLLVAGALSSGFMPVFNHHLAKDDEEGAWKAANTFITVAILFIIVFNILYFVFAKYLIPLVAIGNSKDPEIYALTIKLTRIMTISVSFTVCAGLTMGILNSYKIFTTPALGPVLYNVGIIIGAVLLGGKFGIYGLAFGVILGALMNFSVQIPNFLKVGKRFKFELDTKNESYRRMLKLMGPALLGLAILRINLVVNQNIASLLDEGSITGLRYAQRIMMLPVGIFGASVSTAIFPTLNAHIAKKEYDEYKMVISQGIRTLIFITIPATVGLMVLNKPIVRLLFKTGKFTEQDVLVTAFALVFYAIGILGQCVVPVLTRSFYSLQDTKTPVKIGAGIVVFNITLNLLFVKFSSLAIGGIALTSSLAAIIQMIILYKTLGKKVNGLRTKEVLVSLSKAILSSLAMGVVVFGSSILFEKFLGNSSKMVQLINVGVSVTLGVCVYIFVAYILKMDELKDALSMIKKKGKEVIGGIIMEVLYKKIDQLRDDIIKSTQEICRIRSVESDGKEGMPFGEGVNEALEYALNLSKKLGFKTQNIDGYVGYAEYGEGEDYVAVLGHLDIVPEGDGWIYPPYEAQIHDGKIYARGAVDDKGPIIAALYGLYAIKELGLKLNKKVRIIYGTNEETGCSDMQYYLKKEKSPVLGFTPDSDFPLIFAEKGITIFDIVKEFRKKPKNIKIEYIKGGNRPNMVADYCEAKITGDLEKIKKSIDEYLGNVDYKIEFKEYDNYIIIKSYGISAHGSTPHLGKNAIMQMINLLSKIEFEESDVKDFIDFFNRYVGFETDGKSFGVYLEDEVSGKLSFNVGTIDLDEGGVRVSLNLRYPVTFKLDDMMEPFNRRIKECNFTVENFDHQAPLYFSKEHELVKKLLKVYENYTGQRGEPIAIGGGTYAKEMPNIVAFGPAFPNSEDVAHQANEYIKIDDLIDCCKIYASAIYELCN